MDFGESTNTISVTNRNTTTWECVSTIAETVQVLNFSPGVQGKRSGRKVGCRGAGRQARLVSLGKNGLRWAGAGQLKLACLAGASFLRAKSGHVKRYKCRLQAALRTREIYFPMF